MNVKHPENTKPRLIYDGDCGFCQYWVDYWQKLTGHAVEYRPYQEVKDQYPDISIAEFQKAVQYVSSDGQVVSAAKASFHTLSHAKVGGVWLFLYRYLPGFAFASEKIYANISAHCAFFFTISLFLWGREHEPPRYQVLASLFLRLFALVCLIAFVSFGMQALGLIGSEGIMPLSNLITAANTQLGTQRYWQLPMVFWLNHSDGMIVTVCISGAVLSLLLLFHCLPRLALFGIYFLYLSLVVAGQVFMTFQWDLYILETALICLFMIGSIPVGIWLLRWLLFRFMFMGGMVKILSGDPAWREFTTLDYYFNTEPLPTVLAWYANLLPHWLLRCATVTTLIVELAVPFFFFFPRRLRFFAAIITMVFQTVILITGNYNWFNVLTIFLCLVLFDDAALRKIMPKKIFSGLASCTQPKGHGQLPIFKWATVVFAAFTVSFSLIQMNMRLSGKVPAVVVPVYNVIAPFGVVNVYGPFAVITKDRMEIIIEGSEDGVEWREYAFKYKPDDVKRRPPWNIPMQPRLDWQMWFAALSPVEANPWFYHFMQRLLENSPEVVALLKSNPFPDHPPRFVRALYYDYHFTNYKEWDKTHAWWKRDLVGFYLRDVSLKN